MLHTYSNFSPAATSTLTPQPAMAFMYTATVYVAGYLIVMFVAICLACGLYFLAELAEEHTRLTGKIVGSSIVLVRDTLPRLRPSTER